MVIGGGGFVLFVGFIVIIFVMGEIEMFVLLFLLDIIKDSGFYLLIFLFVLGGVFIKFV